MRKFVQIQLQGGSLVYALMVSQLICLVLGSMVMLNHYRETSQRIWLSSELALDNVYSAAEQFLATMTSPDQHFEGPLFDSELDSAWIQSEMWGIYGLLKVKADHGKIKKEKHALYGTKPGGNLHAALFLKENQVPLKLVGKTRIEGIAYLPNAGVSGGYIGRRGFEGKVLVEGEVRNSQFQQPDIHLERLRKAFQPLVIHLGGGKESWQSMSHEFLERPWNELPNEIKTDGHLYVNQMEVKGKSRIIAKKSVFLDQDNSLTHTCIYAPVIRVEKGFKGTVQLFATDSIILEEEAVLEYPSAILVGGLSGYISIGQNSTVEGIIINDPEILGYKAGDPAQSFISTGALVRGQAILKGETQFWGKVHGTLIVDEFNLQTPSAFYVNHLLDVEISHSALSKQFLTGLYPANPTDYKIIQWL